MVWKREPLEAIVGAALAVAVVALVMFLPQYWVEAAESSHARSRAAAAARLNKAPLTPDRTADVLASNGRVLSAAEVELDQAANSSPESGDSGAASRVAESPVGPSGTGPDDASRSSVRARGGTFGFDFFSHMGAGAGPRPRDGTFLDYHPDGGLAIEGAYENGEPEGEWASYHADGALRLEGQYLDGKRVGRWKAYHPSGQLMGEGDFDAGLREGLWVLYYSNGLVKEQGYFEHDLRHGPWQYYDSFGQLEARSGYYRYGRLLEN